MRTHTRFDIAQKTGVIAPVIMFVLTAMCSFTFAAALLTEDEVKNLVSGNTIYVEASGKGKFKAYLNSNGKATRVHEGKTSEGVWRVEDDGSLCVHYAGDEERCGTVMKNSDGTFTRVDDASVKNHWITISKGKDL